ncbi:hypothetical protein HHI36_018135 [Cryptolaemus montrouzieri]|uniref:Uncharacterized protein n=1 Tax=Cryptolaemus montrouzieri TaxID=559131 RepID=A0ABD2NZC1_9CUCU
MKNCTNSSVDLQPKFGVYIHNETAFNDVPLQPELVTFDIYVHQSCKGRKFPLSPDEDPKILLNGSLLLAGFGEYDGIKNHDEFCIDNLNDNTNTTDTTVYVFVCLKEQTEGYPQWVFSTYITLITVSAILFITSAGFFFRQDVQGIHKKSFIAYALSMSLTYFIVILMQFISGGCRGLGLLLQFFLILSFAWLAILCLDLAWMIHYYRVKDHMDRFMSYVGISVAYSTIFLIPSLLNNFTPDIPSSFFKPQFRRTTCSSFDETQHRGFFYFALIVSILTSVFSLLYFLIKMNQHGNENGNGKDVQWKKDSAKFRNMSIQCLLFLKTAIILLAPDIISNFFEVDDTVLLSLQFLQGLHGLFVIVLAGTFWHYIRQCDEEDEEESDIAFVLLKRKNFDLV